MPEMIILPEIIIKVIIVLIMTAQVLFFNVFSEQGPHLHAVEHQVSDFDKAAEVSKTHFKKMSRRKSIMDYFVIYYVLLK